MYKRVRLRDSKAVQEWLACGTGFAAIGPFTARRVTVPIDAGTRVTHRRESLLWLSHIEVTLS